MGRQPPRHRKQWTKEDLQGLRQLARGNAPTWLIGPHTERSKSALRQKADEQNISPKPTNRSPYNRRKNKLDQREAVLMTGGSVETRIATAIRNKKLIEVVYEGQRRLAEPHVLGRRGKDDHLQVHAFQLRNDAQPSSKSGWRFYSLAKIEQVTVSSDGFSGRRSSISYDHAQWNSIIALVGP